MENLNFRTPLYSIYRVAEMFHVLPQDVEELPHDEIVKLIAYSHLRQDEALNAMK